MRRLFLLFSLGLLALGVHNASAALLGGDSEETPLDVRMKYIDKAKEGDVDAKYEVGMTFCCGDSEYHDVQKATWWLCEAARKENKDAQHMIAEIYRTDRNVHISEKAIEEYPQVNDDVLAYVWMALADKNGYEGAKSELDKIKTHLSAAKLREAKSMVPFYPYVPCEIEVGSVADENEQPINDSDTEPAAGQ